PETRRERRRGLLGRGSIEAGATMLFERCCSVHTFGMRFPIAVACLDRRLTVVRVKRLQPNRVLLPQRGVRHVLECSVTTRMSPGERLELLLRADQLPDEIAEELDRDGSERGRGDHDERQDPSDGAGKRDGLAATLGRPE